MTTTPEPAGSSSSPRRRLSTFRLVAGSLLNLIATVVVCGLAWGGVPAFLRDPLRIACVVLLLLPGLAYVTSTSRSGAGVRTVDQEGRAFIVGVNVLAVVLLLVMVWLSGRGILVLPGGRPLRWAGLAVMIVGDVLRAGTMIQLGHRFSLRIALQEGHTLETRGFYARVRHPSYLGSLLMLFGAAMIFQSLFGVLLTLGFAIQLGRRIGREERFLEEQFGDAWRDYARRTARLLPGVW